MARFRQGQPERVASRSQSKYVGGLINWDHIIDITKEVHAIPHAQARRQLRAGNPVRGPRWGLADAAKLVPTAAPEKRGSEYHAPFARSETLLSL